MENTTVVQESVTSAERIVRDVKKMREIVKGLPAPTTRMQPETAAKLQNLLLNGRPTLGPPIALYCHNFTQLREELESVPPSYEPTAQDARHVYALLASSRQVFAAEERAGTQDHRSNRSSALQPVLHELLGPLDRLSNDDKTASDGSTLAFVFTRGSENETADNGAGPDASASTWMSLQYELKNDLRNLQLDPAVQLQLTVGKTWVDPSREAVARSSPCPTLLLTITGTLMSLRGMVFVQRMLVEHIGPSIDLDQSPDDLTIRNMAWYFLCLREANGRLQSYYSRLPLLKDWTPTPFLPAPISIDVIQEDRSVQTGTVSVQDWLLNTNFSVDSSDADYRLVFSAILEQAGCAPRRCVVKFSEHYGEEVHEYVANELQLAPRLLAVKTLSRVAPFLKVVVMEEVVDAVPFDLNRIMTDNALPAVRTKLEAFLASMRKRDYVHGDLRKPNIYVGAKGDVHILDFEYAGKAGKVKYAPDLNTDILPIDVQGGEAICLEHDEEMITVLLDNAPS
ncbi:hypothetical protein CALVIDRAFT_372643 [Calocera viscosa TUFC12733]|uniref:Protein kinase domain-containing protein n=1 Tax=Calocera viscosa (strain TUFC12733) TaxID=1330018 RepID=A0A167GTA3_CALVF|nr:hypothetical protein CALVIDRAFT_372643 [Calocera viscosa TUFC12733]